MDRAGAIRKYESFVYFMLKEYKRLNYGNLQQANLLRKKIFNNGGTIADSESADRRARVRIKNDKKRAKEMIEKRARGYHFGAPV